MRWKPFLLTFKTAFRELMVNDPLRLAGATAFFTTFALPAILVILIQLLKMIFRIPHSGRRLLEQLEGVIGRETTEMIVGTLRAIRGIAQNEIITILGFLFLLFVATTLFKVIRSSLNQLWGIRIHARQHFGHIMLSRLKGVLVICFIGVLFVLDLVASAAQAYVAKFIDLYVPAIGGYFNSALNYGISVATVTLWFVLVFYFLPDGRPTRRVLITGAFVTSILFNIGKLVLRWALNYSNINSIYGASASTVLLLLFVFYTAMIFYFGAAFTKAWAYASGSSIKPLPHATRYKLTATDE
ncbi:YihY/virulence factor BrkB family protein [Chitinophaga vietnamensis]|uniref:YihY/virulence factor BrkB family protein n=1 Tax=Chitinophaga vietnamensis TaxID=2593957 RepID=UPI001178764F|nr:YihY/virulence factor BrkB family protein [Chitinophaga vietnamensis]